MQANIIQSYFDSYTTGQVDVPFSLMNTLSSTVQATNLGTIPIVVELQVTAVPMITSPANRPNRDDSVASSDWVVVQSVMLGIGRSQVMMLQNFAGCAARVRLPAMGAAATNVRISSVIFAN